MPVRTTVFALLASALALACRDADPDDRRDAAPRDGASVSDGGNDTGDRDVGPEDAGAVDSGDGGADDTGTSESEFGPRIFSTVTVLSDGRGFIVGGLVAEGDPDETWFFDPATETFTRGPDFGPSVGHIAFPLDDGRVLFAGGREPGFRDPETTADAYILDPDTDEFRPIGSLNRPRANALAIPLKSGPDAGKLLIAAGSEGLERILSFELFDPATETFSVIESATLPIQRDGATYVTLDDGRILIAGGSTRSGNFDHVDTALIYDPTTHTLVEVEDTMDAPRNGMRGLLRPDGTIFLFGGGNRDTREIEATEVYDPDTGTFSPGPTWSSYRSEYSAVTRADGTMLLLGGTEDGEELTSVLVVDPSDMSFSVHPNSIAEAHVGFAATELQDGRILLIGGRVDNFTVGTYSLFQP